MTVSQCRSSGVRVRFEAEHHRQREHGGGAGRGRRRRALDPQGPRRLEAPHARPIRSGRGRLCNSLASQKKIPKYDMLGVIDLFCSFVHESARWLISKGKVDKAVEVLKKIAMTNKKEVPDEVFKNFEVSVKQILKSYHF